MMGIIEVSSGLNKKHFEIDDYTLELSNLKNLDAEYQQYDRYRPNSKKLLVMERRGKG